MSDDLLKTLLEAPYVAKFGIRFERKGDELTGVLPYDEHLVGNPLVPALHGGAVGAFMEVVGSGALIASQISCVFPSRSTSRSTISAPRARSMFMPAP